MEPLSKTIPPKVNEVLEAIYRMKNMSGKDNMLNILVINDDVKFSGFNLYFINQTPGNYDRALQCIPNNKESILMKIHELLETQAYYACNQLSSFNTTLVRQIPNYQNMTQISNVSVRDMAIILTLFDMIYGAHAYANHYTFEIYRAGEYSNAHALLSSDYHVSLAYSKRIFLDRAYYSDSYSPKATSDVPESILERCAKTIFGYVDLPRGYTTEYNDSTRIIEAEERANDPRYRRPYSMWRPPQSRNISPNNQLYYDQFYKEYSNLYDPEGKSLALRHPKDVYGKQ